jgi:hypothetical protein
MALLPRRALDRDQKRILIKIALDNRSNQGFA